MTKVSVTFAYECIPATIWESMPSTHTAIATTSKGLLEAIQVPTGIPAEGEVLIKVEYAALVPFDAYVTDRGFYVNGYPVILGFNAAGTVSKVGLGVRDLKFGDRVTAYCIGFSGAKSLQQYTLQPETRVAKIPDSLSLVDAATIPNSFVTAFYTLFNQLSLPVPTSFPVKEAPPLSATPILVYGAGSSVGTYAVQLLGLSGYQNVIVTASEKHHTHLRALGATHAFDYHSPTLIEDIRGITGGGENLTIALDCIAAESTLNIIAKLLSPVGKLAILLPIKEGDSVMNGRDQALHLGIPEGANPFPKETRIIGVRTLLFEKDTYLSNNLMSKILPALLSSGYIKPTHVRLMDQGTFKERAETGLELIRSNKISGEKVIVKVV